MTRPEADADRPAALARAAELRVVAAEVVRTARALCAEAESVVAEQAAWLAHFRATRARLAIRAGRTR